MIRFVDGGPGGLVVGVSATGGRIDSITTATGKDWLVRGDGDEPPARIDVNFTEGTRGGWDECLPSIDAEPAPTLAGSNAIADHGDFWFRPWDVHETSGNELVVDSLPIAHPLRMRKAVRAVPAAPALEVDYVITNRSSNSYQFVYSAHPLWSMSTPASLIVPGGGRVASAFGFDASDGTWPRLGHADLSRVDGLGPAATKFFVEWAGEARLEFDDGGTIAVHQAPGVTPWLGVCLNRRSWPPGNPGADWIALEPTSSPTDSLATAIEQGEALCLAAGESLSWTTRVEFEG